MCHAKERVIERIMKQAGMSRTEALNLYSNAGDRAEKCLNKSQAVRLAVINFQGTAWSDRSNGDEIWAIIRYGKLVTIMFRRSTQPKTSQSLRVDEIIYK